AKMRIYNIQWSHSQDAKANPNSRFSASVNLGSSNYFRNSINTQNIGANMNNTLSSSVSYSKTFQSTPQVNLTVSANNSHNTNTQNMGANWYNPLSTSVSYSKSVQSTPQVNLTVSANHSQNTNSQQISMSLPNFQESMDRIYPFAPKTGSKSGIIQNINLQYSF